MNTTINQLSHVSPRHLANIGLAKNRTLFLLKHSKEMAVHKSAMICELIDCKDKDLIRETFYNEEIKLQRLQYRFYKGIVSRLTNYYNTLITIQI